VWWIYISLDWCYPSIFRSSWRIQRKVGRACITFTFRHIYLFLGLLASLWNICSEQSLFIWSLLTWWCGPCIHLSCLCSFYHVSVSTPSLIGLLLRPVFIFSACSNYSLALRCGPCLYLSFFLALLQPHRLARSCITFCAFLVFVTVSITRWYQHEISILV
jgi:hypothetical protein